MIYTTPKLMLVGSAQGFVLGTFAGGADNAMCPQVPLSRNVSLC